MRAVVSAAVVQPFTQLYLRGPTALGFWGGLPLPNVCARLTRTDSDFWVRTSESEQECRQTIDREIEAWITVMAAVAYCTAGYMLLLGIAGSCRRRPPAPVLVIKNLPMDCTEQQTVWGSLK